jgi:hypothetical protein
MATGNQSPSGAPSKRHCQSDHEWYKYTALQSRTKLYMDIVKACWAPVAELYEISCDMFF